MTNARLNLTTRLLISDLLCNLSSTTKQVYGRISQEVRPWDGPKFVQITSEEAFLPRPGVQGAELIELMGMDQAEFSRRFKNSPVKRAERRGLLRNVAVALGNRGSPEAVPAVRSTTTSR